MTHPIFPGLVWVSLTSLLLASCLDYREELWINGNGSGKLHALITIHSELGAPPVSGSDPDEVESQLREIFSAADGAAVESYQSYVDGKRRVYDFTVTFRDIRQLQPAIVAGRENIGAIFGDFEITRIPDGKLAVKRVVNLGDHAAEAAPASGGNEFADSLGKAFGGLVADAMLGNYHLDYITHFPSEIVTANSPAVDRENHTVTWRHTLADASKGPLTMTAEIKRPGGWILWIFVALIALVTAAVLIPAIRKGRK